MSFLTRPFSVTSGGVVPPLYAICIVLRENFVFILQYHRRYSGSCKRRWMRSNLYFFLSHATVL